MGVESGGGVLKEEMKLRGVVKGESIKDEKSVRGVLLEDEKYGQDLRNGLR